MIDLISRLPVEERNKKSRVSLWDGIYNELVTQSLG